MAILLYNPIDDTFKDYYRTPYENLDEMIDPPVEAAEGEDYEILFFASLTDIFTIAKRRSAIRGRFAKDQEGKPLIEGFALTDDDRDWYDDAMPTGAREVFKKLQAYAKDVTQAFKYGVTFGGKLITGTVDVVNGTLITDNSLALVASALQGKKLVISTATSELFEQFRTILDNTINTITLATPWEQDITGLDFAVYDPAEDYVLFSVKIPGEWDSNQLHSIESSINEALVSHALKEWYLINRYMDDYTIEDGKVQEHLREIKIAIDRRKQPIKRPSDFFNV